MNLKLVVAILVIAAVPVCAQAQKPSAVTKADAQKVLKIISGNKAKTQIYCDITKLVEQITEGDENETDGLYQKIDELAKKLGPEYAALMDGLQDIDPESKVGQEIVTLSPLALDPSCCADDVDRNRSSGSATSSHNVLPCPGADCAVYGWLMMAVTAAKT
jgi:hypothetical protein